MDKPIKSKGKKVLARITIYAGLFLTGFISCCCFLSSQCWALIANPLKGSFVSRITMKGLNSGWLIILK